MDKLRSWLAATHGVEFELLRHFLLRFFDTEMSGAGEWRKVGIGLFATLVSLSIVGFRTYMERYNLMILAGLPDAEISSAMRGDQLIFVGLMMAFTAVLTVLQWQSLFPSVRDYLALAALPVKPRQIFLSKAAALLLMFTVYAMAIAVIPAAAFSVVTSGKAGFIANLAGMAGGCACIFFGLLACQGILLNLLPARLFDRVSELTQTAVFMIAIGGVPLVARQPAGAWWWPGNWFLTAGVADYRRMALAVGVPAVLAAAAYLLSYHRYRRLLLEGGVTAATTARPSRLPDLIRDPREQGAFAFLWRTLARSRMHRLILMAYAALAIGWIVNGAISQPAPKLRDQGMYGLTVTLAPLGIAMLISLGLRYLFSLPVALRANWLFQTTGQEGRRSWMAAVERLVVWFGIAPAFAASIPASIAVLGPVRGPAVTSLGLLAALAWFERIFRDWNKLPFTCSYLPGKTPAWMLMLRLGIAAPLLGVAGHLMLRSSANLIPFAALVSFEFVVWRWLRAQRHKEWEHMKLEFEEIDEAAVMSLDLRPAEQFDKSRVVAPVADMFGGLVASRGLIPQSWSEEIDTERRDTRALVETFLEDVRYGMRLIRRSPLFSAVVVLTLTVGIGINAAVFNIVSAVAMTPHVSRDPGTFVRVIPENRDRTSWRPVSYSEYQAWQRGAKSVRELAAYSFFWGHLGSEESETVTGMAVSCNFFTVEGLDRPILGRLLTADDCRNSNSAPAAVVTEKLWRTRLGGNPSAIGRTALLNSRPIIVVGVVPDLTGAWAFRTSNFWVPYTSQTYFDPGRNVFAAEDDFWLMLAGRLAPGVSRSKVKAEFNLLARQTDSLHPGRRTAVMTTSGSWIEELYVSVSGQQLMLLGFFFGAFNLVLLVSCANVATLLLARAATRRREIAVRLSLGAPRVRLVRMLVTESLLLAALAGAASAWLVRVVPEPLYRAVAAKAPQFPMPPDWSTFAYIAAVVLVTGVLSGLAPALESVKVDLSGTLKGAASSFGGARLRGFLVAAQVALSMVLLVEASLFAKSENQNLRGDPGYRPDRVVVSPMRFPDNLSTEAAAARLRHLERRVLEIPGVHSITFSDALPMIAYSTVELRPPARADASQPVDVFTASSHYFETMGIPMIRGREFDDTDTNAIVITQSLARAFWPWKDPIGQTLAFPDKSLATIVGVVRDVEPLRFGGSDNPAVYRARRANPQFNWMAVRFDQGALTGAAAVRAVIHQTYSDMMPLGRLLQGWILEVTETLWNVVALIVVLGLVATALATAGIYGAVSFAVSQRTRELGIRVALGATRIDIFRSVLVAGGKPVMKGLVVGLWLSVMMAGGLRQGVEGSPLRLDTTNPLLYVAAAGLLLTAALFAMIAPAHRGSKADPLESLRCE